MSGLFDGIAAAFQGTMPSRGIPPNAVSALGLDPGPTTGILAAWWAPATWELLFCLAFECTGEQAPLMLRVLLCYPGTPVVRRAQMESYVARGKSQRTRGTSGEKMAVIIAELTSVLHAAPVPLEMRRPADVMPWASDKRLAAAGLLTPTEHFADARSAGRHALFTAVEKGGLPDPLSAAFAAARSPS